MDPTFGIGGVLHPSLVHSDEQIWAVTPDGPDKFVALVASSSPGGPAALLRIGTDGSPDTSFGASGRVELAPLGTGGGLLLVQPDHRIILEFGRGFTVAMARLTDDGHLDASFNRLSGTPGWLPVEPAPDANHYHGVGSLVSVGSGMLLAVGGRQRNDNAAPDNLAEIYRFDGFPAEPQPIAPYPITAPPPFASWVTSVSAAASANAPAVRLPRP